ncbi:MAG: vanadium-dependent haloperoxidase, partial [Candidatus Saccharibacteria bacterium]|nr:vanadium-dependent haloperoxidase [Pseudorhodobacter sp.]
PTYSPPVASRAFAYLGVTSYEVLATTRPQMHSLAGQLNDLSKLPSPGEGVMDEAVVMHAALAQSVRGFFGNTGPSGQQAMDRMDAALSDQIAVGLPGDVVARSEAYGRAIAQHVWLWSEGDGGARVDNMGFPRSYTLATDKGRWVPTSKIVQQQAPLLPDWGKNRPFAMPAGTTCGLPPPPAYSEDPSSAFYQQAREVYDITTHLTDEQKTIARFWSDDPMLSPTPPGHWVSLAMTLIAEENLDGPQAADVLARVGIAVADSFIGCWSAKFQYDFIRPVTFIKAVIDPKWEPLLITPPFPEYPSGHSTQSGAAAAVLTAIFGDNHAFGDPTHEDDGIATRHFDSFRAAAAEAAISRLYGGIHFRAAIEQGLAQGDCIGAYAVALRTLQ